MLRYFTCLVCAYVIFYIFFVSYVILRYSNLNLMCLQCILYDFNQIGSKSGAHTNSPNNRAPWLGTFQFYTGTNRRRACLQRVGMGCEPTRLGAIHIYIYIYTFFMFFMCIYAYCMYIYTMLCHATFCLRFV